LELDMLTVFISMLVFALIGAISPGPVNIIATSTAANFGFRKALPHVMGATLAYTLIVFLVGIGLSSVLEIYPQITEFLKYIGGAFLLYMSFKIATAKQTDNGLIMEATPPRLLEGALSQWLNPKAWLVSISGVSVFVTSHSSHSSLYLFAFCLISFAMCFIGIGTWAVLGELIRSYLANAKYQIAFNRIMGLLLSLTVITLFTH